MVVVEVEEEGRRGRGNQVRNVDGEEEEEEYMTSRKMTIRVRN